MHLKPILAATLLFAAPVLVRSQESPSSAKRGIKVGIRADTISSPRREIFATWRAYVNNEPERFASSPYWISGDQKRWPIFDLAAAWIYFGAAGYPRPEATLVSIDPVIPGHEGAADTFIVRALYTTTDSAGNSLPVALTRTFAVRERDRWVLASPIPRLTAAWTRVRRGRITFIFPPTHVFNERRAERSGRFVDSLSRAFGIITPPPINFYVADRPEDLAKFVGVDMAVPQTSFGRAVPGNNMILSGLPVYGEWYPHELTHLVLARWLAERDVFGTMDEGMAHWLGGATGRPFPVLMAELSHELATRPLLTLDSLLGPGHRSDSLANRAAAGLLAFANERGGVNAVKAVLTPRKGKHGPDHLSSAADALGLHGSLLDAGWRAFVRLAAQK
ncbi:hypothetical protein [Gemmatimonas sp.]|uniref:hypothetical protein n=1 Tax=Gemmatimonas sp. TaxID=1962908 RepID=UPI0039832DE9